MMSWSKARAVVRKSREEVSFPLAPRGSQCEHCPLGRPRVHRLGETEHATREEMLPVVPARGRDGRAYHSFCGDRFHWIPPHERAKEKELKYALVEIMEEPPDSDPWSEEGW